ncbi:MAG: VanZ family protein [Lachnospiraceae bacterium]|nr:VanZ family protein [Lachnospiraceae bacterium]
MSRVRPASPPGDRAVTGHDIAREILLELTLTWMAIIFILSSQQQASSEQTSGGVVRFLADLFRLTDGLDAEAAAVYMTGFTFFVRKMAHFTEFMILGGLLSGLLLTFPVSWLFRALTAFFIGALYAVSDEIHQYFVEGRAMQVFDMLIDAAGVATGVLFVLGIAAMWLDAHRRDTAGAAVLNP